MVSPRATPTAPVSRYRLPRLLQDIRLLDLLELCGTTVHTGHLLRLSQPTVSRRYRRLARDFGLRKDRQQPWGCGFGTSPCMRLLRLGCRAHRLGAGVARIGSDWLHHPLLDGCAWLLPTPQRFRPVAHWLELVRQGVLDGALISGLELEMVDGGHRGELALVPLGELPLALAFSPEAPRLVEEIAEVLLPDLEAVPGLGQALHDRGLRVRSGANSLHTPEEWMACGVLQTMDVGPLAVLVADVEAEGWRSLRRESLPFPLCSPVWLALPADWQEAAVLRDVAQQLARQGVLQQRES